MGVSVRRSQVPKKAKDHKLMIRDYAWLMISKDAQDHIQRQARSNKLKPKVKFTTTYHKLKIKDCEHKTEDMHSMLVTITHNLCNMIIPKSDGTHKFAHEVDELRVVSGHMLVASRVQIPKINLYNLKSIRQEDGTLEEVDPQD
ncbi:hypothetical protein Tco_0496493 [Tanacetum coccineum]